MEIASRIIRLPRDRWLARQAVTKAITTREKRLASARSKVEYLSRLDRNGRLDGAGKRRKGKIDGLISKLEGELLELREVKLNAAAIRPDRPIASKELKALRERCEALEAEIGKLNGDKEALIGSGGDGEGWFRGVKDGIDGKVAQIEKRLAAAVVKRDIFGSDLSQRQADWDSRYGDGGGSNREIEGNGQRVEATERLNAEILAAATEYGRLHGIDGFVEDGVIMEHLAGDTKTELIDQVEWPSFEGYLREEGVVSDLARVPVSEPSDLVAWRGDERYEYEMDNTPGARHAAIIAEDGWGNFKLAIFEDPEIRALGRQWRTPANRNVLIDAEVYYGLRRDPERWKPLLRKRLLWP